MGFYRTSRNLEASLIDYIRKKLLCDNWSNIEVVKSFQAALDFKIENKSKSAVICVRASSSTRDKIEVGSDNLVRRQLIMIDVFASNDGQRLDLVDFLCDSLKSGFPFLEKIIEDGTDTSSVQDGRVRVLEMSETPVNFNTDKSNLDVHDRYRHLITLTVATGKVE